MANINFIDRAAASTALITTVVISFTSPALATTLTDNSTSTNQLSTELALELQRELDRVVRETGVPGATSAIISPQGTWVGASGVSNLETQKAMLPDDIFAVGSTSKAYTSATVLKIAEEGYLTLDDTLGQWLPEIASNIPDGKSITIRQLLNGTGGIHDYANGNEQFDTDAFNDPLSDRTPEDLVAYAYEKPRFEGESCSPVWCYPNTGYILAGMVVEEATGSTLARVMRDRFFTPLGLNNTFLTPTEKIVGDRTSRYLDLIQADGSPGQDGIPDDITYVNPSLFWAHGSIFANASDVAQFFNGLFDGQLLKPESVEEMLTFTDTGLGSNYGLGVFSLETSWGTAWTTPGDYPGSGSTPYYFPDLDITIVALGNQSFADDDLRDGYRRTIVSNSVNTLLEHHSQSVPEPHRVVGLIVLGGLGLLLKQKLFTS